MAEIKELIKNKAFLVQLAEVVFAIIGFALLENAFRPFDNYQKTGVVYMVYSGFLIITPMHIIGKLMDEEIPKYLALAWAVIGGVLWLAAGGITLEGHGKSSWANIGQSTKDENLFAGIFGIINACAYITEAALIAKYE